MKITLPWICFSHTPKQDIDYIVWTGDLVPHDVWNQTKEENMKIIKETVKQMSEKFPGIPIFPALGNHESSPVNRFVVETSVYLIFLMNKFFQNGIIICSTKFLQLSTAIYTTKRYLHIVAIR